MESIIGIIAFVCAVWVLYDVWTKQKMSTGSKIIWSVFAIVLNIATAIVYYFMKKR